MIFPAWTVICSNSNRKTIILWKERGNVATQFQVTKKRRKVGVLPNQGRIYRLCKYHEELCMCKTSRSHSSSWFAEPRCQWWLLSPSSARTTWLNWNWVVLLTRDELHRCIIMGLDMFGSKMFVVHGLAFIGCAKIITRKGNKINHGCKWSSLAIYLISFHFQNKS